MVACLLGLRACKVASWWHACLDCTHESTQVENEQLRKRAQLLLLRQQLLEEIADELGIKRRNRWVSAAGC